LREAIFLKLSVEDRSIFFEGVSKNGCLIVAALAVGFRQASKRGQWERREVWEQIGVFRLGALFEFALRDLWLGRREGA
jgi:hypothetical protein